MGWTGTPSTPARWSERDLHRTITHVIRLIGNESRTTDQSLDDNEHPWNDVDLSQLLDPAITSERRYQAWLSFLARKNGGSPPADHTAFRRAWRDLLDWGETVTQLLQDPTTDRIVIHGTSLVREHQHGVTVYPHVYSSEHGPLTSAIATLVLQRVVQTSQASPATILDHIKTLLRDPSFTITLPNGAETTQITFLPARTATEQGSTFALILERLRPRLIQWTDLVQAQALDEATVALLTMMITGQCSMLMTGQDRVLAWKLMAAMIETWFAQTQGSLISVLGEPAWVARSQQWWLRTDRIIIAPRLPSIHATMAWLHEVQPGLVVAPHLGSPSDSGTTITALEAGYPVIGYIPADQPDMGWQRMARLASEHSTGMSPFHAMEILSQQIHLTIHTVPATGSIPSHLEDIRLVYPKSVTRNDLSPIPLLLRVVQQVGTPARLAWNHRVVIRNGAIMLDGQGVDIPPSLRQRLAGRMASAIASTDPHPADSRADDPMHPAPPMEAMPSVETPRQHGGPNGLEPVHDLTDLPPAPRWDIPEPTDTSTVWFPAVLPPTLPEPVSHSIAEEKATSMSDDDALPPVINPSAIPSPSHRSAQPVHDRGDQGSHRPSPPPAMPATVAEDPAEDPNEACRTALTTANAHRRTGNVRAALAVLHAIDTERIDPSLARTVLTARKTLLHHLLSQGVPDPTERSVIQRELARIAEIESRMIGHERGFHHPSHRGTGADPVESARPLTPTDRSTCPSGEPTVMASSIVSAGNDHHGASTENGAEQQAGPVCAELPPSSDGAAVAAPPVVQEAREATGNQPGNQPGWQSRRMMMGILRMRAQQQAREPTTE